MKKLECESCGGMMNIDENKEFATCPYCNTKYKLNEDKNIYIKLDEDTKNILKNKTKTIGKISALIMIPHTIIGIIIFIISISIFIFIGTNIYKTEKSAQIKWFNDNYETYSGTKSKFSIEILLDDVITNNKTNKNLLITVIYHDTSTTNPDEIINIKHSLQDWTKYEVKLDYDNNGYVNKVTIEDIS